MYVKNARCPRDYEFTGKIRPAGLYAGFLERKFNVAMKAGVFLGVWLAGAYHMCWGQTCETAPHTNARSVLDCTTTLSSNGDSDGACRTFLLGYQQLVKTQTIGNDLLDNIERFFFEGGECLLSYSGDVTTPSARISAAAHAEAFFTAYVDWYAGLTPEQRQSLKNGGRIRSVVRLIGNALIAEDRKAELHNFYLYTIADPSFFGPDAVSLWEHTLRELHGDADKTNPPDVKAEWRDYGDFLIDWAKQPGMLKDYIRLRQVQHGNDIVQASS
jgi:hypothetical protein